MHSSQDIRSGAGESCLIGSRSVLGVVLLGSFLLLNKSLNRSASRHCVWGLRWCSLLVGFCSRGQGPPGYVQNLDDCGIEGRRFEAQV